ncbi:MAG: Molybdenum cofactor guanylyltransferase [Gammaproteobacteria bacterium]|nr:Molybdenum cofactor guanylyltransferase [Gammaproteobacteria bacterium]
MAFDKASITGIVLAGGRAQRMGGIDKGLVPLCGRTMIEHILDKLKGQVGGIFINANRNMKTYQDMGYRVVRDNDDSYAGPLAGMSSGLHAAETPLCVTVPCDSPLIGADIVQRLHESLRDSGADIAVAHDGERAHPVVNLMGRGLSASIDNFLASGERKIDRWFDKHNWVYADFSDRPEYFINVNTDEERQEIERGIYLDYV